MFLLEGVSLFYIMLRGIFVKKTPPIYTTPLKRDYDSARRRLLLLLASPRGELQRLAHVVISPTLIIPEKTFKT